jgi:hypothetical protein
MYRKAVTSARNSGTTPPAVYREPVPPVERERQDRDAVAASALDFCQEILTTIIKMTEGKAHLAAIQKELNATLQKIEARNYKSVLEVKDDVLQIWQTSLRLVFPFFICACVVFSILFKEPARLCASLTCCVFSRAAM